MKISFITTVFNEERTVGRFLESLAAQTRKPDEVVVVDGGSTDGTVGEIKKREALFDGFKVLAKPCNIAEGRNLAVSEATGEIIAMSDAGCILDERWLQEIVGPFEKDDSIEICAGNWRIEDTAGLPRILRWYFVRNHVDMRDVPNPLNPSCRSVAITRKAWMEMGGQPEFLYAGEDGLFNIKCRLFGKRFVFAEKAIATWLMCPSLRAFGRQVYNYGRAGGRLGRKDSLVSVAYSVRILLVYGLGVLGLGLGLFLGGVLGNAISGIMLLGLGLALYRQKGEAFALARRYGLGFFSSIWAVLVTFYGEWKGACGGLAGLRDRSRDDYNMWVLGYIAGNRRRMSKKFDEKVERFKKVSSG